MNLYSANSRCSVRGRTMLLCAIYAIILLSDSAFAMTDCSTVEGVDSSECVVRKPCLE